MPMSRHPAVDQRRDMPQPGFAHRQIGGEIGQQELDALELDDAAAGLAALVDIGDGVLEGGAGDAERVRRDARARLVQRGEQQRQPVARRAEQVVARHPAVVERQRRGRGGAVAESCPPCAAP